MRSSLVVLGLLWVGCALDRGGLFEDAPDDGTSTATDATGSGTGPASTGSGGSGSGGSGGASACYTEAFDTTVSLGDLQAGYQSQAWLSTMLETLERRYDNGWFVLDAMQDDPWFIDSFPQYFDLASF